MADPKETPSPTEKLLISIGDRMSQLRKLEGYNNHEDFAYDKGINRSQYGKYEKGKTDLQVSTFIRIIFSYKDMTIEKFFENIPIPAELSQNKKI
jgi:transcriptional regulator with XRE-family HTH domain